MAHVLSIALLACMVVADGLGLKVAYLTYKATRKMNLPIIAVLVCGTIVQFINILVIQHH